MIESSRKHGHHDPRYPPPVFAVADAQAERSSLLSIAVWENEGGTTPLAEELSERFGWSAFSTRRLPAQSRHDLVALAAYGRYRVARELPEL